jgi:hypothetical protein
MLMSVITRVVIFAALTTLLLTVFKGPVFAADKLPVTEKAPGTIL